MGSFPWKSTMKGLQVTFLLMVLCLVMESQPRPQFNFGSLVSNSLGAAFNTAFGRDCRGRPQGDYFYGCQCVGPFNIGRRKRQADTKLFINSNQGAGGDFFRCSVATVLNRNNVVM